MSVLRFAQPVRDTDELQARAGALPENTKATTDWGIRVWGEWTSRIVTSERDGVVAVTTSLLGMPPADLAYWMGKFVLEVRMKDGQEYPPKSIYALVCYYEQHGIFDVNPVICLALYIQHQLFNLENSCCCICAGQTVLSHDLYLVHFATLTTLSHAVVCTCSWKSVHYLVIAHLSVHYLVIAHLSVL